VQVTQRGVHGGQRRELRLRLGEALLREERGGPHPEADAAAGHRDRRLHGLG